MVQFLKGKLQLLAISVFCVCLLGAGVAQAVEFKVRGSWQVGFEYSNVFPRHSQNSHNDYFTGMQRFMLFLDAVANEYLSGTVGFKIGTTEWGKASSGGALGADGIMVRLRHAYIDWVIPETDIKVRMGIQFMKIPSVLTEWATGIIWNAHMAGITVTSPIYQGSNGLNIDGTVWWARPYNDNSTNPQWTHLDNLDTFGIILPIRKDNILFRPFFMYALIGKYSLSNLNASLGDPSMVAPRSGLMPVLGDGHNYNWFQNNFVEGLNRAWGSGFWGGASFEMTLAENWRVALEGIYGSTDFGSVKHYTGFNDGKSRTFDVKKQGWFIGGKVEYKFDWGTPGFIAWYGPGDDDDPYNGSERMPQFNSPMGVTSLGYGGGIWDVMTWKVLGHNPSGTIGLLAQLDKMSFIKSLNHTVRFGYFIGTNSPKMPRKADIQWPTRADGPQAYLTTTDTAWEVDFITNYKPYENFNIGFEAAYVRLNLDSDTWRGVENQMWKDNYTIRTVFTYSF